MMFAVFLANIVMDLVRITVMNNATQWADHLGMQGLKFIHVVMAISVLIPMLIRTFSAHWFRYAVVGVTALMTLFVGAHEVSHLIAADKPFGVLHALDLVHHVLGIWVIVAAVMWVRQTD